MRICYCFPSKNRPEKFFMALDNIRDLSESKDYFVWSKLDDNCIFSDVYRSGLNEYPEVTAKWGVSEGKIHSVNRSMEDLPECDIIIVQSDDMIWEQYGFDTEIREAFKKFFPNLDGVVHFREHNSAERTMVLTMMGINLYKQLGYLYHPSYSSVYADNDLTEMTRLMGKYVFIDKVIYTHQHPIYGGEWDAQYRANEAPEYYHKDGLTFQKRKAENFGL